MPQRVSVFVILSYRQISSIKVLPTYTLTSNAWELLHTFTNAVCCVSWRFFCHGISKLLVCIPLLWIMFIIISKIKSHLNLFSKFIYFVHFSIGLLLNNWEISFCDLSIMFYIFSHLWFANGTCHHDTFFSNFHIFKFVGALWGFKLYVKIRIFHSFIKRIQPCFLLISFS